ncbi:hypothetical protein [Streptomyces albipurpureus]|uniref:Uncharacterized protein n=1 Tax=Streptomyces albipurpureus TaxID=2897419 RepID=A0ABT0UML0_9ACTN|nr:hypothetical protein [Streptomyces sp. CWNU-1]MCM2389466.1 hypothetical protein [Streptomyces sp. CWNU-1]
MTTQRSDSESSVRDASRELGISTRGMTEIRSHATDVYHLPEINAVARVRPITEAAHVTKIVALLRWLTGRGFPAVEPLAPPVTTTAHIVTFWVHYPQRDTPPPAHATDRPAHLSTTHLTQVRR